MKVHNIRFNQSIQVDLHYVDEVSVEVGLAEVNELGTIKYDGRSFPWIQVFSTGWTGGARNRVKNFSRMDDVFAYLNKLNAGGWLNDDDYYHAWQIALIVQEAMKVERSDSERPSSEVGICKPLFPRIISAFERILP